MTSRTLHIEGLANARDLGDLRAATSTRDNAEPELDMICRANGTSTQGAFQAVVAALDLEQVLAAAGMSSGDREALMSWRGSI